MTTSRQRRIRRKHRLRRQKIINALITGALFAAMLCVVEGFIFWTYYIDLANRTVGEGGRMVCILVFTVLAVRAWDKLTGNKKVPIDTAMSKQGTSTKNSLLP